MATFHVTLPSTIAGQSDVVRIEKRLHVLVASLLLISQCQTVLHPRVYKRYGTQSQE
jgi:hypothetical protein